MIFVRNSESRRRLKFAVIVPGPRVVNIAWICRPGEGPEEGPWVLAFANVYVMIF